jgi:hypothetical protein
MNTIKRKTCMNNKREKKKDTFSKYLARKLPYAVKRRTEYSRN